MKKIVWAILVCVPAIWSALVTADDLSFPKTESAIVKVLSLKDGKVVHEGVEYVSETGRVWKIIDGKRYRVRGLQAIVESSLVPKAGALINFETNSARILSESLSLLDEFGKALKNGLADASIEIGGHTDNKGAEGYNMRLSKKRAQAVANYLANTHSISLDRLEIKAFGKSKPIASNDSEEGCALNRRVEFVRIE